MGANTELIERWFKKVWGPPRCDATLDELMCADCRLHGLGPEDGPVSREGFKQMRRHVLNRFPDIGIEMVYAVELGDTVAFQARARGTHAPTGRPVDFTGTGIARVAGGKVVETRESWDFLSMMAQCGKIEAGAVREELGPAE